MSFSYTRFFQLFRYLIPLLCASSYAEDSSQSISAQPFQLEGAQSFSSPEYRFITDLQHVWWLGKDNTGAVTASYCVDANSPTTPNKATLTDLGNSIMLIMALDTNHLLAFNSGRSTSYPFYLIYGDNPSSPIHTELTGFSTASMLKPVFNTEATRGWIFDRSTPMPFIKYISIDGTSIIQNTVSLSHLSTSPTFFTSTDKTRIWLYNLTSTPYLYYCDAAKSSGFPSTLLENITTTSFNSIFNSEATKGWFWETQKESPYIYYVSGTPPDTLTTAFAQLTLTNANGQMNNSAMDMSRFWLVGLNGTPYRAYYLYGQNPLDPKYADLTSLTSSPIGKRSVDGTRLWLWDSVPSTSPYLYFLTPDNLSAPPSVSLDVGISPSVAFNPEATRGWIWANNQANPTLYFLTADNPTTPPSQSLSNLQQADLFISSTDASRLWITDSSAQNPYMYFITADAPTTNQSAQLHNLANANLQRYDTTDTETIASQLWIGSQDVTAPYIYYLTPTSLSSAQGTRLTNLQNGNAILFSSKYANRIWISDFDVSDPYIYYLTAGDTISSQSFQLAGIKNGNGQAVSADCTQAWIWDVGNASTYLYYLPGSNLSLAQKITLPTTGKYRVFSPDASYGWIWDNGSPTMYYISLATTPTPTPTPAPTPNPPVSFNWRPGVDGAMVSSVLNTTFSGAQAIQSLFTARKQGSGALANPEIGLLADAEEKMELPTAECARQQNTLSWQLIPFNSFVVQKAQKSLVAFQSDIAGVLLAFDGKLSPQWIFGGGAAYAYNAIHYAEGAGRSSCNQESVVLYGSWQGTCLAANIACWGGYYDMHNLRRIADGYNSSAKTQGFLLSPHLDGSWNIFPKARWFTTEPFVMLDLAQVWQDAYKATTALDMRLHTPDQYTMLLRTEAGVRFYETLRTKWGCIELVETASYVNQAPLYSQNITSSVFVGTVPLFTMASGTLTTENLGALELLVSFRPKQKKSPQVSIDLHCEYGKVLQLYFASLRLSKEF